MRRVRTSGSISAQREEQRPLLFSWGGRALFVGASLRLSPHRNAVAVLALGLDGAFTPSNASGAHRCASALIEPNTLHHLRAGKGRMAFLYIDGVSRDLQVLRSAFSQTGRSASMGLTDEAEVVTRLRAL